MYIILDESRQQCKSWYLETGLTSWDSSTAVRTFVKWHLVSFWWSVIHEIMRIKSHIIRFARLPLCVKTQRLSEGPCNDIECSIQTAYCRIAFQPPAPQANGRFVAGIFRWKLAYSLKQRFWLWEWTFWQQLWSNMILRWYSDVNHGR